MKWLINKETIVDMIYHLDTRYPKEYLMEFSDVELGSLYWEVKEAARRKRELIKSYEEKCRK